ncbi:peptidylprolyl isomerase [Aliikangiella coralliicola]|uniref:peptidylprolyl isomerase n=1 Tax=Aliikangiella coralliicola TaxID=2592383 RepID=A0A545UHW7_9GAMM|nr:peptidylprolyl isomerase [Aliikangiella coralliicola]TQV89062.1 peptidylprolyl isomerase [Aliikangiella coralliicola]
MTQCQHSSHVEPKPQFNNPLPEIRVNGVVIDEESLASELQYHQGPDFSVVVQQAGQALVIKQLLFEEARRKGFQAANEDEEVAVQKLLEKEVKYDDVDESICQRYFENNRQKFTTSPLLEVDHILLAAAKDDIPAREVAKNQAKDIISQLQGDPLLFPTLATEFSACPSKKMGGSLGQISHGQTVPEFERQISRLPQGLAKSPIESRYGFHVVNVTRKIEGKLLDYSMVADKVRGYLVHRSSHLAVQAYIQQLVEAAEIQGIEMLFMEENIHI